MYRGTSESNSSPKGTGYYLELTTNKGKHYKLVDNCWKEEETGTLFKDSPDLLTLEAALVKRRELQMLDGNIEIFYETGK